jgi:hypothetical protein
MMEREEREEREDRNDLDRARRSFEIKKNSTNGTNGNRLLDREVPVVPAQLSAEEALEIAIEAYVYAYPLVLMDVARATATNTAKIDGMHSLAPINQFAHAPGFPDARFSATTRPNVDGLSSSLWFDASKEPLVVSVPESRGHYYLMSLLDMWADVFASLSTRTAGVTAQRYAIVGPGWDGTPPDGVEPLRAPTSLGLLRGQTQPRSATDLRGVHAFQGRLRAAPLSEFGRTQTPPHGTIDPSASKDSPVAQVARMSGTTLFARFDALIAQNPPHPNDYPQLGRMKRLGLVPGVPCSRERLSHNAWIALDRAVPFAQRKIRDHTARAARIVNGWSVFPSPIGTYGTDYLKRALMAHLGLGADLIEDAIYATALTMPDGSPFDSGSKYELRFPQNGLPPVRASWSLTMYDDRQLLADNPFGRYSIGDRDPLRYDSDGSLMVYIQRESPGRDRESNWLPTPKRGEFSLTMRLYWPEPAALNGTWAPPIVKCVRDYRRPLRRV